ncbi:MAG: LmbE family protein [Saprospirales bacterium]|nr:LmbE family protein [Saprospirales bacterium]
MRLIITLFFFLLTFSVSFGQKPQRLSSADIYDEIKELQVLGSALYVAAHPDDENTRLISWLASSKHIRTAYLSLTRGDGGQNLIGTEIAELLGVIRTQELLAARRLDGGHQFFSRANDFGYSKHPDETLRIWNKNEVLSDAVRAIRRWQPDVIITRFDPNSAGRTHGHHTASAMLALEAYEQAGNPNAYPDQLTELSPWQPRRIFFNTSWWFYGSRENFEKADKSKMVTVDVGTYFPLKGKSNNEIAAESRSQHKSQGFGSIGTRGSQEEYLDLLRGDMPKDPTDLFDGINTTWSRLEGGAPIGKLLKQIELDYRHDNPAASVPALLQAYAKMGELPDSYWKRAKMEDTRRIIEACLGLFAEAVATDYSATPGDEVTLDLEIINRSDIACRLEGLRIVPAGFDTTFTLSLENNVDHRWSHTLRLPKEMPYTAPYWLDKPWQLGMYEVDDPALIGLPETPRKFKVMFSLNVAGFPMVIEKEVVHKYDDDVKGEVYRPFEITPPVFANFESKVFLFTSEEPQEVSVRLRAGKDAVAGEVQICLPDTWRVEPETIAFEMEKKGEEKRVSFLLYPPASHSEGKISPILKIGDESYTKALVNIEYDHIPPQMVVEPSEAKVARMELKKTGGRIAYIMGAGDLVPDFLRQIGYQVDVIPEEAITAENLKTYDAVVVGIRAYNVLQRIQFLQPVLLDYVKNGGTMVVQYNTSRGLNIPDEELAPYPLKLSRDRVTVEEAPVSFLAPNHPVLNFPNKITEKDFEGWVQERGLYFPNEWSDEFTPILEMNDPGEDPKQGSLLVAKYGEGYYIYTGLSFFRELPAGVTGAYRLFANLLSIGDAEKR